MKTKLKSTLAALSLAILAAFAISGCANTGGGFGVGHGGYYGGGSRSQHDAFSGGGVHGGNIGH